MGVAEKKKNERKKQNKNKNTKSTLKTKSIIDVPEICYNRTESSRSTESGRMYVPKCNYNFSDSPTCT